MNFILINHTKKKVCILSKNPKIGKKLIYSENAKNNPILNAKYHVGSKPGPRAVQPKIVKNSANILQKFCYKYIEQTLTCSYFRGFL